MSKTPIMLGMFLGSAVGSYLPLLWGADIFSISSVLLGALGGLLGIYSAYKITISFF